MSSSFRFVDSISVTTFQFYSPYIHTSYSRIIDLFRVLPWPTFSATFILEVFFYTTRKAFEKWIMYNITFLYDCFSRQTQSNK